MTHLKLAYNPDEHIQQTASALNTGNRGDTYRSNREENLQNSRSAYHRCQPNDSIHNESAPSTEKIKTNDRDNGPIIRLGNNSSDLEESNVNHSSRMNAGSLKNYSNKNSIKWRNLKRKYYEEYSSDNCTKKVEGDRENIIGISQHDGKSESHLSVGRLSACTHLSSLFLFNFGRQSECSDLKHLLLELGHLQYVYHKELLDALVDIKMDQESSKTRTSSLPSQNFKIVSANFHVYLQGYGEQRVYANTFQLQHLLRSCPNLEHLGVVGVSNLVDALLMPKLSSLAITQASMMYTDSHLKGVYTGGV